MWEKYRLRPTQGTVSTIPVFVYGTAWKKERSAVYNAIKAGFRAVDTAAQPRHYQEHLIGDGIRRAIADGTVQTKYSPVLAQELVNLPYDPSATLTDQVHASIKSSLHNLRSPVDPDSVDETYIDTVIIHSPLSTLTQTLEAWHALETVVYFVSDNCEAVENFTQRQPENPKQQFIYGYLYLIATCDHMEPGQLGCAAE
ncbi:Aldo-keto reductase (AKR), putative [Penicillium digitatum]|uniref:Aldo-keto reductase (AKR), putative n=1 Tax=Penicillium digitatum TaxID=36651 RepID=A0A7T6XM99_PENDI|nr:Aldo-keto reductase (AKR), putative [Penicillium digitatum]